MEVYLSDVSKMVYAMNKVYYTYEDNSEEVREFTPNDMPVEIEDSKVSFIECRDNSIIFYLYD